GWERPGISQKRMVKNLARSADRWYRTDRPCLLQCERPNEALLQNPPTILLVPRDRCGCLQPELTRRSASRLCSRQASNLLPIPRRCHAYREGQIHWQESLRP